MKRAGGLIGLLLSLAIIYFVTKFEFSTGPKGATPPKETIDIVGVKSDLIAIGQAERYYLATKGAYGTVDQLTQDGDITFSGANRRGYNFTADVDDGQHFKVTASPADPAKSDWPTLSIDDTMQVTEQ